MNPGALKEQAIQGVTIKSLLAGSLFSALIAVGEPYGVMVVRDSQLCADFSTGAAFFLFFVIVLMLNAPLKKLWPGASLSRQELLVVYIMMIVSCAIPSWGLTMSLLGLTAGLFYYATPENNWAEMIHPYIPDWIAPRDKETIWHLFEGAPKGEGIPWAVWLKPLVLWSCLILAVYFVTICMLVLVRKQWAEREKLLFPLAIPPVDMTEEDSGSALPRFFRNYIMWIGFAIPFLINAVNGLHTYYHAVPPINLSLWFPVLRRSAYLNCRLRFEALGLAYLLNTDVSMGLWFFPFLLILAQGTFKLLGISIGAYEPYSSPALPIVAHFSFGAFLVLVIGGFWRAREHLKEVFSSAFKGNAEADDTGEIMSYKTAVFGLMAGCAFALIWLTLSGLDVVYGLILLASALLIFLGLTRIVSQTGLAYARGVVIPQVFIVDALGSSLLGARNMTALTLSFTWCSDLRTLVMASAATGLKIADVAKMKKRALTGAILLAIFVSLAASIWAVLEFTYRYGAINLLSWQFGGKSNYCAAWTMRHILNPLSTSGPHLLCEGIGVVTMMLLTFVKNRFVWWPIHPVGLAVGYTVPIAQTWFSIFLAWLFKVCILKWGGAKLYKTLRPLFIGMVLGLFCSAGFWLIIDTITGVGGNWFTLG